MITKQEFKDRFELAFEKQKKKFSIITKFIVCWVVFSSAFVLAGAISYHYVLDAEGDHLLLNILIAIFSWFGIALLPMISFKDKLLGKTKKSSFAKILAIIYGDGINYDGEKCLDRSFFDASGFCGKKYTKYGGEDYFSVEIKRETPKGIVTTTLEASDLKVESRIVVDGKEYLETVFAGAVGVVKFKQPFGCVLCMNCENNAGLEQLETESTEFNKIFSPKTNNQIQARLILSVTMMQTLLDFQKKAKCKIGLSFKDDCLFVSIKKNLFEFSKKDDNFDYKLVEPIYDDLAIFDALITEIVNNRKIFRI